MPREPEAIVHGKISGISLMNDTTLVSWPTTYPNLLYLKGGHKSHFGLNCSVLSLLMFPGISCYHHLQCLRTNLSVLEVRPYCRWREQAQAEAAVSTRYLNVRAMPCTTAESHQTATGKSFRVVWATFAIIWPRWQSPALDVIGFRQW